MNEYTYDVYDNGSGKKIKTVKQNGFIRINTQGHSQNAYTRKDGKVMVENASGTKYKTFNSHDSFVNGFGRSKSSNLWWYYEKNWYCFSSFFTFAFNYFTKNNFS